MIGKNQTRFNRLARAFSPRFPEAHWPRSGLQALYLLRHETQNLALMSNNFADSVWIKTNITLLTGQSDSQGGTNATKLVEAANSGWHDTYSQPSLPTDGTTKYVARYRVKAAGRTWCYVGWWQGVTSDHLAYFDLANGVWGTIDSTITAQATSLGGGWYDLVYSFVLSTANAAMSYYVGAASGNNGVVYFGDGSSGILVEQNVQLNPGIVLNPHIPTTTNQLINDSSGHDHHGHRGSTGGGELSSVSRSLWLPGVAGNRVTAPFQAGWDLDNVRILIRAALPDWTPIASAAFIEKAVGSSDINYLVYLDSSGNLRFAAGNPTLDVTAGALSFVDGSRHWLKVEYTRDTGSVQYLIRMFYAADQPDIPSTWTQLGSDLTGAGKPQGGIGASVGIGSRSFNTTLPLAVNSLRVIVQNLDTNATVQDCNPALDAPGDVSQFISSTTGEKYTIFSAGEADSNDPTIDGTGLVFKVDDIAEGPLLSELGLNGIKDFTMHLALTIPALPSATRLGFTIGRANTRQACGIGMNASNQWAAFTQGDDLNSNTAVIVGEATFLTVTHDAATAKLRLLKNGVEIASKTLGAALNLADEKVLFGAWRDSVSNPVLHMDFTKHFASLIARVQSDAEIQRSYLAAKHLVAERNITI